MSVPEKKLEQPTAEGGVVETLTNLTVGTVAEDRVLQDKGQAQDSAPSLAKGRDYEGMHRATLTVVQGLETLWRSFDSAVKAAGSATVKADRLWAPVIAALSMIYMKCKQDDETMPSHLDVAKRLHAAGHIQSKAPAKQNASPYVRMAKLSHPNLWSKDAAAALSQGISIECADGETRVFPTPVEALAHSGRNFTAVDAAFSAAVNAVRTNRNPRKGPAGSPEEATVRAVERMRAVAVKYTTEPDDAGKAVTGKITIGSTRTATVEAVVALLTPWKGKLTKNEHKVIRDAMGKASGVDENADGAVNNAPPATDETTK